jgi:hypothetical protein
MGPSAVNFQLPSLTISLLTAIGILHFQLQQHFGETKFLNLFWFVFGRMVKNLPLPKTVAYSVCPALYCIGNIKSIVFNRLV